MPQNLFLSFPTIPPAYLHHISLIPAWLCCSSKKKEKYKFILCPIYKIISLYYIHHILHKK